MPTPLHGVGLGVVDGTPFAVGGAYETAFTTNEAFTPNSLAINTYSGLTIWRPIETTHEIDGCSNWAASNLTPLTTFMLSNNPYFCIDTNSTSASQHFNRELPQ